MRLPKPPADASIDGTSISWNLPYFQLSIASFHSLNIAHTCSSRPRSRSVETVSPFSGFSIAKISRPAAMSSSFLRMVATAVRYSAMSSIARSGVTSAWKGASRWNSLRLAVTIVWKSVRFCTSSSLKSFLAFCSRLSASVSVVLYVDHSRRSCASLPSSSSLIAT